jgi:hypothetical protein
MMFVIYRCKADPDYFVITDPEHKDAVTDSACPNAGGLEKVGDFKEMGENRVAFNEDIAKDAIKNQGFYLIESETFDPVAERPGMRMPGGA